MNNYTDDKLLERAIPKARLLELDIVQKFAKSVANLHGAEFAIPFANRAMAIEVAMNAIPKIGPNGHDSNIAVSTSATYDTWGAIVRSKRNVSLVDIDTQTGLVCPYSLEHVLQNGSHVNGIILDHGYGHIIDPQIGKVLSRYPIFIINDISDAFGVRLDSLPNRSDIAVVSCEDDSVMPVGGAILLMNDSAIYGKCLNMLDAEQDAYTPNLYKMSQISASVGQGMLVDFNKQESSRRSNATIIENELSSCIDNFLIEYTPSPLYGNKISFILHTDALELAHNIRGEIEHYLCRESRMRSIIGRPSIRHILFPHVDIVDLRRALPGASRIRDFGFVVPVHASWTARQSRRFGRQLNEIIMRNMKD